MNKTNDSRPCADTKVKAHGEQGFTLIETAIALVIMMIVSLAIASLFTYSINYNSGANDRTLAHAVAQQQMERLRRTSFSNLVTPPQPEPDITSGGRKYSIVTTVCANAAAGCGGSATLKKITVDVRPQGAGANWVRSSVRIETLRADTGTGAYFQ